MNKKQWIVIASAVVLFSVLYFGFDTKPSSHRTIEEKRSLAAVTTDAGSLVLEAKKSLGPQQAALLNGLEAEYKASKSDSAQVEILKQLSSNWYKFERPDIAGYYAEEVANLSGDEEAWSIAGTTYSICLQRQTDEKVKDFCTERAISALETAASLNPSNLQHKVNLALVYTEQPPQDNPMKGILMLVEMNKQYPENVSVLTQLGRLAIKTGQFEKAIERLGKAAELEPTNRMVNCLLANAYSSVGNQERADFFNKNCEALSAKEN
jgi:tetratricopeptide (TPR) repeat protein